MTVKFDRDFAGTCWETCNAASDGKPIAGCSIKLWRVKTGKSNTDSWL